MRGLQQGHVIGFFSTEPNNFHTKKPVHDAWIKKKKDGAKKYATLQKILADIRAGR